MKARLILFATLLAVAVLLLTQFAPATATSNGLSVTYSHGVVHASIPYQLPRVGTGNLTVEILDPADKVLGKVERRMRVDPTDGEWREDIPLVQSMAVEDLVWQRLRYRFVFLNADSAAVRGTETISQVLRTPVLHVLGQNSYFEGGPAAVRVIATDTKNAPLPGTVRIELGGQSPRTLYTGPLNQRGTTEAQFRFPAGLAGLQPLHYTVDTPLGSAELVQNARLEDKSSILLTTEKPVYQPGQIIHIRALALDRANHEAEAGHKLTFEMEDSRGNKVFKKATQTSKFGIASAEFTLADEVNLGTYHLRALMEGGNSAETALNVERYVLPKFKVAVEFSGQTEKARHGYRPGDHVTGTVRANYFFGKPVEGEVTIKAIAMDVAQFEAGNVTGKTDADGVYHFDLQLPTYFAGRPLSQGAARVLIEASVKDSAAHSETRGEPITVSESPLLITAVPEGGSLAPNLDNQVFVLTSYADGKPAQTEVKLLGQTANTDASGVAVVTLKAGTGAGSVLIQARDHDGNTGSSNVQLTARQGTDQILLRTERAVYRAGDRMALKVFSTKQRGSAYVDVVKEGQTVLTRDVDIVNGQAELSVAATGELAGTLDINAYQFGADARPVADHRLVFVQPADELKVEATTDRPVYKPGDDAQIRFRVTNAHGQGVQAALGLQIVDEAVFALAEKQPGFAKVFFYLEQEAMKPRYEIHSIGMPEVVETAARGQEGQRDLAARALFAATEMVHNNRFDQEAGRQRPMGKMWQYHAQYQQRFSEQVSGMYEALGRVYRQSGGDLTKATGPEFRDAWENKLRIEKINWTPGQIYMIRSAGPDQQMFTGDDLMAYVEAKTRKVMGPPAPGGVKFDVEIEHDRGPMNGLAAIAGSVTDFAGAGVPDATIQAREVSTGKTRTAKTDAGGQFSLAGVPAGKYDVQVSAAGFNLASRQIGLQARDRAVLTAALQVGTVTDSVVITAAGVGVGSGKGGGFGHGEGGGVGGGVFRVDGGVLGGIVGGVPGALAVAAPRQFAPNVFADRARLQAVDNLAVNGRDVNELKKFGEPLGSIGAAAAPHVRSWFPEALYINPEIITDQNGVASISIPLADSITTWRMAMMASTPHGALGSGTAGIKVFQDFFADLDLPVTLTQGDRVTIPVAIYNYAGERGNVSLQLQPEEWYSLVEDQPDKKVTVESGHVGSAQYTLQARRIGKFKLTLAASMAGGAGRRDIVVREIEVVPDGREQTVVFNGRLEASVKHDVNFPAEANPEASKVFVRLYPGPMSQVVEGMDAILRMPGGCFEQTSSSTYPNVLALDYMKRTKKLTPEVHAKAEGFIANGYQRLLTFEVPGGGFSWFGQAPANKILTAYGLMEFYDMSQVHDVDPNVIQRTQQWLAGQQQADGSWKPDTQFINEGATNRYNTDLLRITSYIAWSLENTGYKGPAVEKAKQYVQDHQGDKADAYTLAVLANFAADYGKDRDFTGKAMQRLLDAKTEKDEQVWWSAEETNVYGRGPSAAVETTGLAVQGLLKWGQSPATVTKALAFLTSKKDASGTWGTTQATIMALRALLQATGKAGAVNGTVEITLNGKPAEKLTLTEENNDLLHQFVFPAAAANSVEIRFNGQGGLAYQVAGRYFVPWNARPANEPLSIAIAYDRTRLSQDDIATATATVRNNLRESANMVMVDLGIPPGFDLQTEDLQSYQEKTASRHGGRLEKFNLTATQAILYFDSIPAGQTVTIPYRLRAKYPIRARTFQARVYEYYSPEVNAVAAPVVMEVQKRR